MKSPVLAMLLSLFIPLCLAADEGNHSVSSIFRPIQGQPFDYRAQKGEQTKEPTREQGQMMMFSEPVPNHQTVEVKAPVDYQGRNCWVIATTAEENNPNFGANPYELKTRDKIIKSYIAEDGQILYIETVTKMGGNSNQNMETNLPAYETLNHFYGKWMLDLKPDYEFKMGNENRGVFITVEKEEKLGERNCYVARVIKRMNGEVKSEELFWIDVEKRIAIKSVANGTTLDLVDVL